ncbi:MAG: hypothetical protein QM576_15510 [Rhodopseudomonas sp.]
MEHGWTNGRDMLTSRDVLVIDEAGMVGTRQLETWLRIEKAALRQGHCRDRARYRARRLAPWMPDRLT